MFGSAVPGMPLNPMNPLASSVMNSDIVTVEDVVRGISTGYVLLDAMLCLLVPLIVQLLISALFRSSGEGRKKLWTLLRLSSDDDEAFVIRTIEITQRFNNYGNKIWDYEQKNHLLQKAVSIYLSKALDLENKDTKYVLFEKTAADLSDDEKDDVSVTATNTTASSNNSDDEYEDDEDDFETSVDKLYVKAMPLCNVWVEIEKGVEFMHEVEENNGEKKGPRETKVTFKFRSKLPDASDRIDALIDRAYSSYRESERRKHITDKTRYFYIQSGTKDGSGGGDEGDKSRIVAYKRYALGEEKTFDNLFFQEKKQVLQLLDNFTNKSGKFAIKGFPYKLGLLLHGPPGTGKTSLIKAIAQYTKRHIVTISLAKIKTNQELLDALFDMKFAVHGHDTPFELTFNDVVFVMEDIDCASSIVNSRGADDDDNDKVKSRSSKMIESQKKATKDDDGMEGMIGPLLPKAKNKDKLNLSGLLNVLDGVIDCPGRILIMTTNHPEKLDPALIRPGRVNKKLFLSHMEVPQAREMIEYYCSTSLKEEETHQLERIFEAEDFQATPAELEELCAEFDDAATILKELSAKTTTQN